MRKRKHITSYGRLILARMEAKGMTLWDLAQEVERRTGIFCDEQYISNHLRGYSHTLAADTVYPGSSGTPPKKGEYVWQTHLIR
jgi:hypothetical protein